MRLGTYYRYLVSRKLNLPLSGNEILDIGCYDGFLLSHIDAAEKFGIDVNVLKKYPDIQYIEGDFMKYDFNDKKFDRIFALDVLEHVSEDRIFLEKIIQLLSIEGVAILSTPCENIKIFPSFLQDWVDKRWGHIYRRGYVPQKIKELVEDVQDVIALDLIYWNCPIFRFLYLPLSALWRINTMLSKKVLNFIVGIESIFKEGENGFLYIVITRGSAEK
jgi:SAM-dependent methyltransferase